MTSAVRFVRWLHHGLIRLYPYRFRQEFGCEIEQTFDDLLQDAAEKGRWAFVVTFMRELRDIPRSIFDVCLLMFQEEFGGQTMFRLKNETKWRVDEKREAIISALPPLIFGFGMAISALIIREPWYQVPQWRMVLGIGVTVFAAAILAIGAFYALWKRIPDWSYSWVGYAYMGAVLFIKTFAEEQADLGLNMVSPITDQVIAVVVLLGVVVFLGVAAWRGWQQAGLLSFSYAGMLSISLFGMVTAAPVQRFDLGLLVMPASLLMAILIYAYCRGADVQRGFVLLGGCLIYLGTLATAFYAWRPWYLEHGGRSPILPLLIIFMLLLLSGPISGVLGIPLRRVFGKEE